MSSIILVTNKQKKKDYSGEKVYPKRWWVSWGTCGNKKELRYAVIDKDMFTLEGWHEDDRYRLGDTLNEFFF